MIASIIHWVETYGVGSLIAISILGAIYLFWAQYLKYYFEKKSRKEIEDESTSQDEDHLTLKKENLKNQDFFSTIEFKLNVDLPTEEFPGDETRAELLKLLIELLLESYHDNMQSFISSIDFSWSRRDWSKKLNEVNYNIVNEFRSNAISRNVPPEAIKRFLTWFTPYRHQIFFYIQKIAMMQNKNPIENTNTYLLLLELILMNVISDVMKFESFNGDLDGLQYNGKIIGKTNK